ncbi:hypothetical protein, partial [Klebsiella pneumoniae]|uniref:hypothetical protein n=1 Tax=Klebsiella pneumoniae TaxID=573 RepID=UPI001F4A1D4F
FLFFLSTSFFSLSSFFFFFYFNPQPQLSLSSFLRSLRWFKRHGGSPVRSPVPAMRFTGVIPLLWPRLSHSTPDTPFRVGSSLQSGLYARTPRSVRLLRLFL